MGKLKLLYVVSARSAYRTKKGRKITSILAIWKQKDKVEVKSVFGGNLNLRINNFSSEVKRNIRKPRNSQKDGGFFVNTISELLDITHDIRLYFNLLKVEKKPSIVWERSSRLHFSSLLYAKKKKAIYVHEWIDNLLTLYKYSAFKWMGRIVENIKKKYSDFIVVPNGVIKDNLVAEGIDKDKILVAYNAVDTAVFFPDKSKKETFTVTYIGSYAFYHDIFRLIKAIKILQDKYPDIEIDYQFVGDGMHAKETMRMAKDLNLQNITFNGRVDMNDVPKWINEADICVLPGSTDIICPIKIMEFMGCGTVPLLPDYECNKEVVTNGVDGVLFKPFDEEDLADKILWSFNNKEKLIEIGNNALKTCLERFTWGTTWNKALKHVVNAKNIK